MQELALVDLDGTLADDRHRHHFYEEGNFAEYFSDENVLKDPVFLSGHELVAGLDLEHTKFVYLTGRRSTMQSVTEMWLDYNGFPPARLLMKPADGHTGYFKFGWARYFETLGYRTVLWDDDPETVEIFRSEGLIAVQVPWSEKPEFMLKGKV